MWSGGVGVGAVAGGVSGGGGGAILLPPLELEEEARGGVSVEAHEAQLKAQLEALLG